ICYERKYPEVTCFAVIVHGMSLRSGQGSDKETFRRLFTQPGSNGLNIVGNMVRLFKYLVIDALQNETGPCCTRLYFPCIVDETASKFFNSVCSRFQPKCFQHAL